MVNDPKDPKGRDLNGVVSWLEAKKLISLTFAEKITPIMRAIRVSCAI